MKRDYRLLFGPLAALILLAGIGGLASFVPGYNPVHQTVSEIGEMDSPMRIPFAVMLFSVAASALVFAAGLRAAALAAGRSTFHAYVTACMAISCVGVGVFAFPHPLHNDFGLSETIGYLAPLFAALAWRRDPREKTLVRFSWLMFVLLWISVGFNISTLDRGGALFAHLRPIYGLVQRSLFVIWAIWAAGAGFLLFRRTAGD
jgi:hypothetical membrane protein